MRILHVISSLEDTDAAAQLRSFAAALPNDEFPMHVCTTSAETEAATLLAERRIPLTLLGERGVFDLAAIRQLLDVVRTKKPDVVQTWDAASHRIGSFAARFAGVPNVVSAECDPEPQIAWSSKIWQRLGALRNRWCVVSTAAARELLLSRGWPKEKLTIIPPAASPVTSSSAERRAVRAELGLSEQDRLVGLVAPLEPIEEIKRLLWAGSILREIRGDVHLLLIGRGTKGSDLLDFAYQAAGRQFAHLAQEPGDRRRLLTQLDCLCVVARRPGRWGVVVEALAAGVPVLAADSPAAREFIQPGETGLLVPYGDSAAYSREIMTLLDDPQLVHRLTQAGLRRAKTEFSAAKLAERFVALYLKIATGSER